MTDTITGRPEKAAADSFPVAAGAPSIEPLLYVLLTQTNAKREIAMAISNFTGGNLTNPQHYIAQGIIEEAPLQIGAGQANAVAALKTVGMPSGTAAVVTYDIGASSGDSKYKLAVLWSVPSDYAKHSNRFNFALLDVGTQIDNDVYERMLKGAASASQGKFGIKDKGFQVSGVMSTGGQASFTVEFKDYPSD